ncbi:MAG: hypothetical protein H0T72_08575, partial [Chloroflexia bacterium]|nr:hypothetical protein [Chloroflexia bacterium]
LEAAESVMAAGRAGDVMESVISLAAIHLVLVVADEPRFTMLETIREFALECLTKAGEEGASRRGHAVYFTSLAENAIPFYDGPQANNYRIKIERELENCRAALGWSVAGGDRELAIRLSGALYRVWWNLHDLNGQGWQEYIDEGRRWLERALEMRDGLPLAILVEAIMGAATYALLAGDLDRAQAWGEELRQRSEREGQPYGQFNAYQILGRIAMDRRDLTSARNYFDKALASAPLIRDPDNHAAIALMHLGFVAERSGYLERAETRFRDAVAHSRLSGNAFILHEALVSMGRVGLDRGNLAEAMKVLHECYQWSREEPSRYVTSDALIAMSLVALGVRDQKQAVRLLAAATTSLKLVMGQLECTVAMDRIRDVTPKPVFNTAWEHGERMSWTEIDAEVASLLGHVLDHAAPAAAVSGDPRLTPREREVLRLVAEGKSNRAIGDALSISERTVENHVQHILARLNLESRTAAATWAVRHGLV